MKLTEEEKARIVAGVVVTLRGLLDDEDVPEDARYPASEFGAAYTHHSGFQVMLKIRDRRPL